MSGTKRPFVDDPVWAPLHNVLICDGRPGIRQSLTRMARQIHTAATVNFVADEAALIAAYLYEPIDLVLIGLLPGAADGAVTTRRLLARFPTANVILYGSVSESALLTAAVAAGAHGFLLWTPDQSWRGATLPGSRPSPPPAPARSAAGVTQIPAIGVWPDPPTERELQVLRGISRGQTNREIGRELFLSVDTVKMHASRLFRRLGAQDRGHAVALAMRHGLVS